VYQHTQQNSQKRAIVIHKLVAYNETFQKKSAHTVELHVMLQCPVDFKPGDLCICVTASQIVKMDSKKQGGVTSTGSNYVVTFVKDQRSRVKTASPANI